jgi:[protein-PII] uridylyltransferase
MSALAVPYQPGGLRFDAPPPEPPPDDLAAAASELPEVSLAMLPPDARADAMRRYLAEGRALTRKRHETGAAGRTVMRLHSVLLDRLVRAAYLACGPEDGGLSLVALGGYGRVELAPFSDVDLLLLHDGSGPAAASAEAILYLLWDSGLQVGHAVRTPAECLALADADHTARTALVECRFVAGDADLFQTFEREILGDLASRRIETFVGDKLEEWKDRHERFGRTVFRLEPDVKFGEGGLREMQTAMWIARAIHRVTSLGDLKRRGLLAPREVDDLRAARDFLWRVRTALHYRAGRQDDHLTFDAQEEIAAAFGYVDTAEVLAVERFMRDYYLSARTVARVSRNIVEICTGGDRLPAEGDPDLKEVAPGLEAARGFLVASDPGHFDADPANLVRVFEVADREGLRLHPTVRDRVRQAVVRQPEALRESAEAAASLRRLFEREGTRGDFLQPMHDAGVLGTLVPEFGRQTGLWQHDLYHQYTVDVHSLFALRRAFALRSNAIDDPRFTEKMQALENPYPFYLGVWFHDIGKGMGGGHSEKGAAMMPEVCRRLRLSGEEADEVAWLVRSHLRMSHVSQRRDLSDPALIAAFAEEMGSLRRLTMLYLLTFADVGTTGEKTWTDWKATLLTELYDKTRAVLIATEEGARPVPHDGSREAREGAEAIVAALRPRHEEADVEAFLDSVPDRYLASVPPKKAAGHLALLRRLEELGPGLVSRRVHHRKKGYTELSVATADRPGLLADLTGVLAAHRVDILGAQIFSLSSGRVLDVFEVRDRQTGLLAGGKRWRALRADLAAIPGEPGIGDRLVRRRLRPGGLRPRPVPPVPVAVKVDNEASDRHTVVDVFARDRLGLLHSITATLHELGLDVWVARVATEAHRATDAFYVTGADGRKITDDARLDDVVSRLVSALEAADDA